MAFYRTNEHIDDERRLLCGSAAALAASGLGLLGASMGPALAAAAPRSSIANYPPLRRVTAGSLNIAYAQMGPDGGPAIILLHGWPYDIYSFTDAAPILAAKGYRVIVPYLRGHGGTRFVSAQAPRNGQPAALA